MVTIRIYDDAGAVQEHPFEGDEMSIGRAEGSDVRLTDLNVSRRHARFIRDGGDVYLEEVAARYGTYVNGQRLQPEGRVMVRPGDRVRIGDFLVEILSDEALPAPPADAEGGRRGTVPLMEAAIEVEDAPDVAPPPVPETLVARADTGGTPGTPPDEDAELAAQVGAPTWRGVVGFLLILAVAGGVYFLYRHVTQDDIRTGRFERPVAQHVAAPTPATTTEPTTPPALGDTRASVVDAAPAVATQPEVVESEQTAGPATTPQPTPVAKPEPKPEPKPVAKPEPKPEPTPVAKPEPKPEPTPVAKPEPKPEPKPVAKPEPKPEPKPVAKPEPMPEPKPVAKPEPKPEPAASDTPQDAKGLFAAAEAAKKGGSYSKARRLYRAAIKADPGYAVAYRELAKIEEALGNTGTALRHYRTYLRLRPNARDANTLRALVQRLEERY